MAADRLGASPYWLAFACTLAIAFVGGVARPDRRRSGRWSAAGSQLTVVIASIGLLILVEGSIGWIWGNDIKFMPTAFPAHIYRVGGVAFSRQDISTIAISIAAVLVLSAAVPVHEARPCDACGGGAPEAARLVGVRVSWMLVARLGARGRARRGLRHDGRRQSERLAAAVDDGRRAHLRLCGRSASAASRAPPAPSSERWRSASVLNLLGELRELGHAAAPVARRLRADARRAARRNRPDCSVVRGCGGYEAPRGDDDRGHGRTRGRGRDRAALVHALRLPPVDRRRRRRVLHRDPRAEHRDRLHRADLDRAGRVHGLRRLHDGDPDARPRLERPRDSARRRHSSGSGSASSSVCPPCASTASTSR